jgi:LuxR family maltose regulon positive regulatory protein
MSYQTRILLKSKLNRPPVNRGFIDRPQLLAKLNYDISRPLTLVIAPAGFGKTTLVSTWLEQISTNQDLTAGLPSAWLSLDENDSDPFLYYHYFIAALSTIFRDACKETLALLRTGQRPPFDILSTTLSNDIEQLSDFILVLDDYHTLQGTEIHDLLNKWALHWPRPLHLVLLSRFNPPIPLTNLRAKGLTCEIRTQDLRFNSEEIASYLGQVHSIYLNQPALSILEERFEGWPAGLYLAALSFRSQESNEAIVNSLASENANIAGYLMDEVLSHQFPAVYSFLLKTSILDRFCVSLCETVVGETDEAWNVQACLDWIVRSELFIVALDNNQEWYRYHQIFRELLQKRFSIDTLPEQVTELHRRASTWYEKQGLIEKALQHALAAGNIDLVAHQMSAGLCDRLNHADRLTLERWLRLLPEEVIQRRPELLMIRVWVFQFNWQPDLQAQTLQQIEEVLASEAGARTDEDDLKILNGQIQAVRAQLAYFSNQLTKAIDHCRQVLDLLPASWLYLRGGAMMYLGMSLQADGRVEEAERIILNEYMSYPTKTDIFGLILLQSMSFIYLNSSKFERSRQIAQALVQGSLQGGITLRKNWGEWFLGMVDLQQNRLEAAKGHFHEIFKNRYQSHMAVYRDAIAGMALIHMFHGESAEAFQLLESISQSDIEQKGDEDKRTRSLRARLMLKQGDLEGAGRWADSFNILPTDQALTWLEEPQVTRARILVARGAAADLQLVQQILDPLDEIVDRTHNTRYKIEILALRALALDAMAQRAQGETGEAEALLKQAVELAQQAGVIWVFIELGKPMQGMLQRLAKQSHPGEWMQQILSAFPQNGKSLVNGGKPALTGFSPTPLVESLTPREYEVLTYLRGPMSYKEIALKLNISYATVKRHTINIYSKLNVNQRWKAVASAEELSILPPC